MSTVAPPPIEPGAPGRASGRRGCARQALVGCGALALVVAVALISILVYLRRHPERMTDVLMRQVESGFAADVTAQEKEDLRASYSRFRESLVRGTANRQSLQDIRSVLLSRGMGSTVSRDQVHALTEIFRNGARPDAPTGSSPPPASPGETPAAIRTP